MVLDKEKNLLPNLPASLALRRGTPAVVKAIAVPAKARIAGQAAAFTIEEEDERRRSIGTTGSEVFVIMWRLSKASSIGDGPTFAYRFCVIQLSYRPKSKEFS